MKLSTQKMALAMLASVLLFTSCSEKVKTKTEEDKPKQAVATNFKSWSKTPPMGWNSWDCYGPTVTEEEVKANANYMASNLKEFGWEYVVVDIRWFVENTKASGYNQTDPIYVLDEFGRYQPAVNKFPSAKNGNGFKALADYVHSKGLKFGIHIMRGIPVKAVEEKLPIKGTENITADQIYSPDEQCTWLRDNYTVVANKKGAQEYYNSIFEMYAQWGVDFVKVDDLSAPIYHEDEINLIRNAINNTGREIVLSTSPGETPVASAAHVSNNANMWRMVNDVWDEWWHIKHLIQVSKDWYPYIGNGTWPDCDMIPLGRISIRGERGNDRQTRLTQDEQYTLITFFNIFKSPLFFGGDLPSLDPFTLSLLTNKQVQTMHSNSVDVKQVLQTETQLVVTSKNPETGEVYVAMFNIGDAEDQNITVALKDVGIDTTNIKCTNMWTGKEEVISKNSIEKTLKPHQSILVTLTK